MLDTVEAIREAVATETKLALPKKCCAVCRNWTRGQPDDATAPEGKCGLSADPGHWPTGYWPHTLQRDACTRGFVEL